jgi:hypothetical protein
MTKSLPGGTPGWDNRTKKCPSDGIDYAFDDDYPHVNNDAPKDPFKVAIRIIMYSTPDCTACKEKFQLLQLFVSIDPASRKTSVDPFNSPWKPPGAGAVLPCE